MIKYFYKTIGLYPGIITLFLILFSSIPSLAKVQTQFIPILSVSEEYTDNYNQTTNDKDSEFSTIYSLGMSFGILGKNSMLSLNYDPEYTDYESHNESDSWHHDVSIEGQMQASKRLNLMFSEMFSRELSRTTRTNAWEEADTNTTTLGGRYNFGERDYFGLEYTYSFNDYENFNIDENKSHNPSMSFSYWFTPLFGISTEAAYEKTDFDGVLEDPATWSGSIRFLKSMNRHFDAYLSYAHTDTDRDSGDHRVYNPSVGFDWRPSEDSGISMGLGVLFQEWDRPNVDDSEDLFLDLDAFKEFNFSRKGSVTITGSSGYVPNSNESASLGFNIYYEAGVLLNYRLTRQLSANLSGTYEIDQFEEPGIDRKDNQLGIGAGLEWQPLKWLTLTCSYSFIDFDTNATTREDYQENVGAITIRMTPSRAVRFGTPNPRAELEDRLFE